MSTETETRESNATLHLPEGQNYACVKCGRSCEMFDEVELDPQTQERWAEQLPSEPTLDKSNPAESSKPIAIESPWNPGKTTLRKKGENRAGNACCLLNDDRLCEAHCTLGEEAKPVVCRTFPYKFVDTPDGVYVGLSFACTAVLRNEGPPIGENESDVRAIHALTGQYRTRLHSDETGDEVLLSPSILIPWKSYGAIEADLSELLDAAPDVGTGLIAQSTYLGMLTRFLLESKSLPGAGGPLNDGPAPDPTAAAKLQERIMEVFRVRMRGEAAENGGGRWQRIFAIAGKPKSAPLLRRVFLGYVLALRRQYDRRLGAFATALATSRNYAAYAIGRGEIELPESRERLAYRDIAKINFEPDREDARELLARYFKHCLHRKDLALGDDVRFAHNIMLTHYGLIGWYARAFALSAGRSKTNLGDLQEAIRTVEAYFGLHYSTFGKLFTANPRLKAIMIGLFSRPIFAFAMTRGPEQS